MRPAFMSAVSVSSRSTTIRLTWAPSQVHDSFFYPKNTRIRGVLRAANRVSVISRITMPVKLDVAQWQGLKDWEGDACVKDCMIAVGLSDRRQC